MGAAGDLGSDTAHPQLQRAAIHVETATTSSFRPAMHPTEAVTVCLSRSKELNEGISNVNHLAMAFGDFADVFGGTIQISTEPN
jgi:hypothetical protein